MAKILVGSTIPAFAMEGDDYEWWLANADAITREAEAPGHEVEWLAVLQHDSRGTERFDPLIKQLARLSERLTVARPRWFSLDIGDDVITSGNRLVAICTGRNLIVDYALQHGHDWIHFADSDIEAPDDVLLRLLEVDWPVVGAHVPTYCLDGKRLQHGIVHSGDGRIRYFDLPPGADIRRHWNTAGSLLVHRDVFRRVPWRYDPDAGCTDDPATQGEMERLGYPTLVRHDVVCTHHPECIGPLEQRGHDLAVYR